eukprot:GAHX01002697.1.p1 GENE.GAHX01002697.1~~GAHX01002697.1.p1  ORF type:complete len:677 (+),score=153.21 GAHX01002697.1:111-2141(+)
MKQHNPMTNIDKELPILKYKNSITSFIQDQSSKTMLITGTTGSGKSTEVPLISLTALTSSDTQKRPRIVVSQPRRLAAIELGHYLQSKYKDEIGYKTRFFNRTSSANKIVFLTDGILFRELSELTSITKYDIIIIDEVHERSIATELLLGILRKHIDNNTFQGKLILMSSTVDTKTFLNQFKETKLVNIEKRTYNISKVYTNRSFKDINKEVVKFIKHYFIPIENNKSNNKNNNVIIKKEYTLFSKDNNSLIQKFITKNSYKGTVLIFLPGIDHINSLYNQIQSIGKNIQSHNKTHKLNVYKLHSKTPSNIAKKTLFLLESQKDLNIVISTNVAETSLTIPNVKYVIDIGLVKKKFFLDKLQLEIIKLMPISKQEAVQREGRCGRTHDGLCVKFYTDKTAQELPDNTFCSLLEDDYSEFLLYIVNNNNLNDFPFLNKLKKNKLKRSLMFLLKLELLNNEGHIVNETVKKMIKFPLHPKYIKIILEFNKLYGKEEKLFIILVLLIVLINEDSISDYFKSKTNEISTYINNGIGDLKKQLLCVTDKYKINKRIFFDVEKKVKQILIIYNKMFNGKIDAENIFTFERNDNFDELFDKAIKLLMKGMFYNLAKKEKGNKYKTLITEIEVNIHSGSLLYNKEVEYIIFDKLFQNNKVYCRNCEEVKENDIAENVSNIFRKI